MCRSGVATLAVLAVCAVVSGCADTVGEAAKLENGGDLAGAVALYKEVLEDEPNNVEALEGVAVDLMFLGLHDEALVYQERLIALDEGDMQTRIDLGFNYLNRQDRPEDAARVLREAVEIERSAKNLSFLAQALIAAGDPTEGERRLREAIEMEPGYGHSYSILVKLLESQGRTDEAETIVEQGSLHGVTVTDLR